MIVIIGPSLADSLKAQRLAMKLILFGYLFGYLSVLESLSMFRWL